MSSTDKKLLLLMNRNHQINPPIPVDGRITDPSASQLRQTDDNKDRIID